jgi:hypothetical protein
MAVSSTRQLARLMVFKSHMKRITKQELEVNSQQLADLRRLDSKKLMSYLNLRLLFKFKFFLRHLQISLQLSVSLFLFIIVVFPMFCSFRQCCDRLPH